MSIARAVGDHGHVGGQHVAMQADFQPLVDSSISKTIKCPFAATHEDVDRGYRQAIEQNCKGLTVYRVDSRNKRVLSIR